MGSNSTGRLAGLAAAAGAAALLIVQGAQAAIGPFDPRWEVQVLIIAGIVCLTLLTQRLTSTNREAAEAREQAELLEASVRVWPLPSPAESDPQALGVFPSARDVDADVYVERDLDKTLERAVSGSAPLLLVGPPRAGKSRTALEAVRTANGEARLLAPRNAHSLRRLLDMDPRLAFGEKDSPVLWLDGLSRHVKALDDRVLDGLAEAGVPVVATAREKTWRRMLSSEGQDGEAAKALAARARTFELPLVPSGAETRRAERLLEGHDVSKGIGPALSSKGTEPDAPNAAGADTEAEPAPERRESRLRGIDPVVAGARRRLPPVLRLGRLLHRRRIVQEGGDAVDRRPGGVRQGGRRAGQPSRDRTGERRLPRLRQGLLLLRLRR